MPCKVSDQQEGEGQSATWEPYRVGTVFQRGTWNGKSGKIPG